MWQWCRVGALLMTSGSFLWPSSKGFYGLKCLVFFTVPYYFLCEYQDPWGFLFAELSAVGSYKYVILCVCVCVGIVENV